MSYGYITKLSENVERQHIRYNNRYGTAIAADIYTPKNLEEDRLLPAIVIGAPYGSTKEQAAAIYANTFAQLGFVTLAFDQVYMGESAGEPRHVASPDLYAESFSAAVDYLGTKAKHVNREQISVIGISGGAGFALSAAAVDTRIKSVVTISMYDMTDIREMANLAPEQLFQLKDQLSKQRWNDFENGQPDYHPSFPEEPYDSIDDLPNHDELTNEWLRFYALKRGFHPNARGTATTTSNLAMLEFSALDYIKEISPRPILFIYGDNAHSRSYSERAYYLANQPKQRLIVENCEHIDLYDNMEKIPVDQIAKFIKDSFNA
ncbi:alpha/beta hydrolase [Limosilactobacillus reuteri]|uniref:Alpha/beta fold hydrolase n=2 Tax=Limosilactobacillus reuteri TaxID=1598 RepID=A0AAJ1FEV2_LIMRT|nr:alpha/beta hydrolase [Limosilactobacillus reuteri]AGR65348.1 membrane protein [Limosilactobacillus reuteri TD1]MBW3349317.1 alpha/beta hydrolase [Limosilactobacillus reuteri]MCH5358034.1 alpha/beta hydrolase [Limosilactobacillus reuteri]MRG74227.1 alpha/beta fold hydrolase [Limosilactobacillus reuteri]MRG84514.1 alpha/beta fold hydrolase [Limosilactobacillus reuteri]